MLIDFRTLFPKYNINAKGIIQVGAHWAEEHDVLDSLRKKSYYGGIKLIYIEPCSDAFEIMVRKVGRFESAEPSLSSHNDIRIARCNDITMLNCACADYEGYFSMNVSHNNQGQSNSLLQPKLHLQQHPEVAFTDKEKVRVIELDKIIEMAGFNILLMDCQGAEGLVLKGATDTLKHIDMIYTECNRGQTYEGNMEIEEMDTFLSRFDFVRVETFWPSPNWTWGDCVYLRKEA